MKLTLIRILLLLARVPLKYDSLSDLQVSFTVKYVCNDVLFLDAQGFF